MLSLTPAVLLMFAVGGVLIYLAIAKKCEPTLLLPIGFGVLLGNLPNSPLNHEGGMLYILKEFGIQRELVTLFVFIGIGAMMDFRPLLSQPLFALLGAAGQLGIFATLILATLLGFPLNQAASIAVIGAIAGPTSIYVSSLLAPELLAPIAITAYSYMSLVPIIQPPIMRLLTTREERRIRMPYAPRPVPRVAVIVFPIVVTVVVGLLVIGCDIDAWKSSQGIWCRSTTRKFCPERTRQHLYTVPWLNYWKSYASRNISSGPNALHSVTWTCGVRP